MRTSFIPGMGAVALIAIASLASPVPANADPAYTAAKVLDIFTKDKKAAETNKKLGASRKFCFQSDPDCGAPSTQPVAKFDLLVTFEFDSDKLTAPAKENLSQFAKALLDPQLKGQKFEIDGHTDASGAEQYNLGLSERRANAVVGFLASQGVDAATLLPKGFGKLHPRVADPFSPENRRVETHLTE
jgi:outer membrane protein OmpA-like peptidoglycan-associated protein